MLIIYLFDKENTTIEEVISDYNLLKSETNCIIICPTKIDLFPDFDWEEWITTLKKHLHFETLLGISAKTNSNIELLKHEISEPFLNLKQKFGNSIVVNQRHFQELTSTQSELQAAKEGLQNGLSGDLVAFHLRDAIKSIGNITGEVEIDRDILGTIFGKFCIGK